MKFLRILGPTRSVDPTTQHILLNKNSTVLSPLRSANLQNKRAQKNRLFTYQLCTLIQTYCGSWNGKNEQELKEKMQKSVGKDVEVQRTDRTRSLGYII